MQGIVGWLDSLGLGEYASRFAENGVDLATLPDLTEQDFKELGVLLGHRRKLARAMAAMGDAPAPPPRPSSPHEPEGERRRLTVLFCDLVGSTSIAARLDAEEWRDLVGGYLDAASAAVREMGAMSRRSWATASWRCSAIPPGRRTTPSARCGRRWRSSANSPN